MFAAAPRCPAEICHTKAQMLFSASVSVGNERYYAINEGKFCRAQHRGKDLLAWLSDRLGGFARKFSPLDFAAATEQPRRKGTLG